MTLTWIMLPRSPLALCASSFGPFVHRGNRSQWRVLDVHRSRGRILRDNQQ
jgi:hypothetical protein